jgi:hypothetical protein
MSRKSDKDPVIETVSPDTFPAPALGTLKSWRTGVLNPQNMPVLMLETNEGVTLNIALPPQAAVELGQSLQRDGETTLAATPAATN